MKDTELFYRLALNFQEKYTPRIIKQLLKKFDGAQDLFHNFNKIFKTEKPPNILPPTVTDNTRRMVEREMATMERNGLSYCFYSDENFPKRLRSCNDSPYYFFYKGASDFNFEKSIAVVGTRNASTYGTECVKRIIGDFKDNNIVIISGLAHGIDTAAHEQALENRLPTIAVMGTGFKNIYPTENRHLAERIIENGGTLISEYFFNAIPDRTNFPRRNRIIAGLSDASVIVETASKGGSIITAYIAHSYNRDVFAVPGNLFSKNHDGCHELIRKNVAALVTSGKEIIEMMNWDIAVPKVQQTELFIELDDEETRIVEFIRRHREASIDEIIELDSHLSVSKITSLLLGLEFKNVLECKPGKRYVIVNDQ